MKCHLHSKGERTQSLLLHSCCPYILSFLLFACSCLLSIHFVGFGIRFGLLLDVLLLLLSLFLRSFLFFSFLKCSSFTPTLSCLFSRPFSLCSALTSRFRSAFVALFSSSGSKRVINMERQRKWSNCCPGTGDTQRWKTRRHPKSLKKSKSQSESH